MSVITSSLAHSHPSSLEEFTASNPGALLELCEDLIQLQREGLIEPFTDECNVVRYRPAGKLS